MSAGNRMSRYSQVQAMPPEAMIPAHVAREAVAEVIAERLSPAMERQLTIAMWVEIGTRAYRQRARPAHERQEVAQC